MARFKQIFFALTRKERLVFFAATALAITSGIMLLGIYFIYSTKDVPASGGEYTEGMLGQPAMVNPVLASSQADNSLVRLIFSNVNDIAQKIETSPDGRIWKIRLQENLRWQDGEKLTSDDVIFTIQKIQDPGSSSPLSGMWQGVAAQRSSELELQLSLVNPYAFFPDTLNKLYILPKHVFENVPPANWRLSDYNIKPIGSGQYMFSSYEKKSNGFVDVYRLVSWENYHGEKALIGNINFNFYTTADELLKSFNGGQIDAFAGIDAQNIQKIGRPFEVFSFKLPNYFAIFFNQNKSIPLKDRAVRRALSLATNRQNIIKEALKGYGRPAFGPVPDGTDYFDPQIATATSSTDAASSTLNEAGWKLNDSGFRGKTVQNVKIPLEINLSVPQTASLLKTADIVKNEFNGIGVKINVLPPANEKNRDYEAILFGNTLNHGIDLYSFWHSSARFYPGSNLALYNNKKADALIESITQTANPEKRASQFKSLQELIVNDYPAVFLYSPDYLYITSKNIRGVNPVLITEPADRFVGAGKWYLKTARVLK